MSPSGIPVPAIPSDQYRAICSPLYGSTGYNMSIANGTITPPCALNGALDDAAYVLNKDWEAQVEDDWKRPLSVLFNAFIMMQVRTM